MDKKIGKVDGGGFGKYDLNADNCPINSLIDQKDVDCAYYSFTHSEINQISIFAKDPCSILIDSYFLSFPSSFACTSQFPSMSSYRSFYSWR